MPQPPAAPDTRTVLDLGERALVERITAKLGSRPWVLVGPGDDAAVVTPEPRTADVLTTDALVDGVHFDLRLMSPEDVGHRALAVNLSDLAAMGARPRCALLSLVLPSSTTIEFVDRFLDGILRLAASEGVAVAGGNVTRSPGTLVIDVTAVGAVHPRRVLRRSGARAGDDVYVTGTLGDGATGLASLRRSREDAGARRAPVAEVRYRRPEARTRAGHLLSRNKAASACIDLSDGLGDGLRRLAEASGAGMTIDAGLLPVREEVRTWAALQSQSGASDARGWLELALDGGDDYELLFTASPRARGRLRGVQRLLGDLPITRIGQVTKDRGLRLLVDGDARPMPGGFEHFR